MKFQFRLKTYRDPMSVLRVKLLIGFAVDYKKANKTRTLESKKNVAKQNGSVHGQQSIL